MKAAFCSLFPIPCYLLFQQLLHRRLDLRAKTEPHAEFPLNLPSPAQEQQGRQVLDVVTPPKFLAGRAAEVHVEELDFVSPLSFEPMHDGPRRLAAQSEVGIKM